MSLLVNLRHLAVHDLVLRGELPVSELDLDPRDEMVKVGPPLRYDLEAQQLEKSVLVRGRLQLTLHCQCVRCLKPFEHRVELNAWTSHLPLQGEDQTPVVNDCMDLTPIIREDILLEFPRHPLCEPECRGLEKTQVGSAGAGDAGPAKILPSAWAELDKLKF